MSDETTLAAEQPPQAEPPEAEPPLGRRGRPFDPTYHEAVGSDESAEYAPGVVTEELQRGYRWGDEVLRPARVRVAT